MTKNLARYDVLTITLHWVVALLVIAMLYIGWYMGTLPRSTGRTDLVNFHKSLGTIALLVVLLRIIWRGRMRSRLAGLQETDWQAQAARTVHFLLYACMLVMPLTGFLGSHFGRRGILFFGFQMGPFFQHNTVLSQLLYKIHDFFAWIFVLLVGAHVLAALWHRFWRKDGVLRRMLPGAN